MSTGAELMVRVLKVAGVKVVFGIPGIHNIPIYEALRKEPAIRHILCRHETTAAQMADGYARACRRLGVVIASTGPGSGFNVPAFQEAWGSCSPVLLITTNIATSKIGQGLGAIHELEDQDILFKRITKERFLVRNASDIEQMTQAAIDTAISGRPGPVYLEVPTDLFDKQVEKGRTGPSSKDLDVDLPGELEQAVDLIHQSKQPIIIAGTAALRTGLGPEIIALAETLSAPVITTVQARGLIPEDHSHAFGYVARKDLDGVIQSCDLGIAVGTRLREVDGKNRGLRLPKLIHLDWDSRWIGKNHEAAVPLEGEVPAILRALLHSIEPDPNIEKRQEWLKDMRDEADRALRKIREENGELHYLDVIRRALPRNGVFVIDNTLLGYWADYYYPSYCPGGLIAAKGSVTIGFAFAAAIGAKLANPETPLIALMGDGGFLYCAQELATCIQSGIGFPLIVVNDNAYGAVRFFQHRFYKNEYEVSLTNPDFVALARAFGAKATRVDSPEYLSEALKTAMGSEEMWLIEVEAAFPDMPAG